MHKNNVAKFLAVAYCLEEVNPKMYAELKDDFDLLKKQAGVKVKKHRSFDTVDAFEKAVIKTFESVWCGSFETPYNKIVNKIQIWVSSLERLSSGIYGGSSEKIYSVRRSAPRINQYIGGHL